MEKLFTAKIDNLIQNYCYNFLSYLYVAAGWKRIIFETSKENYIVSNIPGKKIRIVISNIGNILLTCHCFTDILTSVEYLIAQFEYGRMWYYLVLDQKLNIKWSMTETFINGTTVSYDNYDIRRKLIKEIKQARKMNKVEKKDVKNVEKEKRKIEPIKIYMDDDISEETLSEEAVVEEKIFNPFSFFSSINFSDIF